MALVSALARSTLIAALAALVGLACGKTGDTPEAEAPPGPSVTLTRLSTPEASVTALAKARGFLVHDPHAALGAAQAVIWRHGPFLVRPLSGALAFVAEDLSVPVGRGTLTLGRPLVHTPGAGVAERRGAGAMTWDEHLGLGPGSARCSAGAACDPEGRVVHWVEGGVRLTVTWADGHPTTIAAADHVVAELRYTGASLSEILAAPLGATTAERRRVAYTRDAAGRIEAVDGDGGRTTYRYDALGRLIEVARGDAVTRLSYDAEHRVTAISGPGALATRLSYAAPTAAMRADVSVSDALGAVTRYTWSAPSAEGIGEVEAVPTDRPERATRWRFDRAGRVEAVTAAGARTELRHDAQGRLVGVRYPDGLEQRLDRDPDGRLVAVVEGEERVAITMNARGDITAITRGDADRETWTWSEGPDGAARLARIEHVSGRYEAWDHDAYGRLVRMTNSDGAIDELRYDEASGLVAATRDERGVELVFGYDAHGRPTARTGPDGAVERWTWDAAGRLTSHVAPGGAIIEYAYDALDRVTRIVHAGETHTFTHDALGRLARERGPLGEARYTYAGADLVEVVLPDGRTQTLGWDAWGRLVEERTSDGARRTFEWRPPAEGGRLARETVHGRLERRFTWDALGRLARLEEHGPAPGAARDMRVTHRPDGAFTMKDERSGATWTYHRHPVVGPLLASASTPSGAVESYTYDARGRLLEKTSSLGQGLALTWDARGRPVASRSSAGTLALSWTADGRLASLGDEGGLLRRFEYDAAGHLVSVSEGASRWRLIYERGPDPIAIIDPSSRRTSFTYDDHLRLASRTSPAGGTERYAYDDAGRLVSHVRGDGATHTFTWDELGRLARHEVDGALVRALSHDASGRLVRDEGPRHRLRVAYDDATRTRTTFDEDRAITTARTRDAVGRTEGFVVDGTPLVTYRRRPDGRLARVEGPGGFAVDVEHDSFGRRTGLRLAGGGALRYRYDAARRLVGLELSGADGATWSASFAYDRAGRLASQTIADETLGYVYDDRGRLAALALPDGARREYAWSDAGELVRLGDREIPQDDAGRPVADGRAHDLQGRLSSLPGARSLAYDAAGRLEAITAPGARAIGYAYDGDGRLRRRLEDGAATAELIWDGDELLEVRERGVTTRHVAGEVAGERLGFVVDGAPRYLVQGPDGSTLAVADGRGRVLMSYLHEPFGAVIAAEGSAPDPLHYRGRFVDPASGLVHYPMRWYDPEVGAFIAPDPDAGDALEPASLHRYAYLLGDPVNHVDPLGAQAFEWGPETCLEAVCKLFQSDKIKEVWSVKDGFSYVGAIDKRGWVYDVWAKRVPGTDRVLTVFRDLNERASGPFQGAGLYDNIVLNPDGPRNLQLPGARPIVSATPAAPAAQAAPTATSQPGLFTRAGATIREGFNQAKLGVQLYGKEVSGTVAGLGGLSGTLGTSLGTLAALPGGGLIIAAGTALAGAVGYGVGTLIDKIPGVSEGAQILISNVLGYDKDQLLADLKAQIENEGDKAKEHREKTIADNLAKDTMPPPPEPGVAGGTVGIGDPPPRDRDRPPSGEDEGAPDAGAEGEGEDEGGEEGEDDEEGDDDEGGGEREAADAGATPEPEGTVPGILDKVAAKKITFTFTHEIDMSAGEFKNIIRCTETLEFWNVGAMASGYAKATINGRCEAGLAGTEDRHSHGGTFSGGPDGIIVFVSDGERIEIKLSNGQSASIPEIGTRTLPADAFADWPKDIR